MQQLKTASAFALAVFFSSEQYSAPLVIKEKQFKVELGGLQ